MDNSISADERRFQNEKDININIGSREISPPRDIVVEIEEPLSSVPGKWPEETFLQENLESQVIELSLKQEWPNEAGFQTFHEQQSPTLLHTTGHFPAYAAGTLYRTGPSSYKIPREGGKDFICNHWFDGFGQTYRFEIIAQPNSTAKVMYSSRRSNDKIIENIKKTGKYGWITFAQRREPCIGIFGKVMSVYCPAPKEPAGINIAVTMRPNYPGLKSLRTESANHSNGLRSLWAASDISIMKELDLNTLEPIGTAYQTSLHPDLTGPLSCAHSMSDPETGDMLNYNLAFGWHATYRVFKTLATTGKTEILATITGPGVEPSYIHSFFMTADYVILGIWGARLAWCGFKVLFEQNMLDAFSPFDPSQPVKWFIVDRKCGKGLVAEFESAASFCFHTVNAWQEDNMQGRTDIVCDCLEYENLDVMQRMYYENLLAKRAPTTMQGEKGKSSIPRLARYRLSNIGKKSFIRGKGEIRQAELVFRTQRGHTGDLPTINPRFKMMENRYVWTIVNRGYSTFLDGISKYDLKTKEVLYWDNPVGHTPGEAIFIPNPEGVYEDEGVLLSVVLDGFKETSYLVCLDAMTMKELGRAECDWAVGIGTHGAHIQGQSVLV